ncbi:helix-turn-helix transcriptional regulator [Candidatus Binatus sp.]|jgi:prophage regulatory protein|uniref:helix-turn-helix transcriptional regulator n=1 Tax=Candidatus Binatus sp. TaxID=2811406 RepID=UPI003C65C77B
MDARHATKLEEHSLLRLKQVLQLVPVCASTWWNGVRAGKFPKPLKLGPKTTCWKASDVLELIDRAAGGGEDAR